MAHTFTNLWPQVVAWDNLVDAYHKCRRRKRYKPDAARFDFRWESHLLDLQRRLIDSSYRPRPCRHFWIFDPKKRRISAAPFADRVVHHAVVNVLEPMYEPRFIFDSYACRKGKGTHRALDRAEAYLRRYPYYLKTDIVKFFPSIDHAVLLGIVRKRVADGRLLDLIGRIVATGTGVFAGADDLDYWQERDPAGGDRDRGLPIGNLTSQFFANVLLDEIDHAVKDEWGVGGYVRYCDDLILFGPSKGELRAGRARLEARLASLRLRLHPAKTQLRPSSAGVKFLGFSLGTAGRRVQQVGLRRVSRRVRRWHWLASRGALADGVVRRSMGVWRAWVARANATGIGRALRDRALDRCPHYVAAGRPGLALLADL